MAFLRDLDAPLLKLSATDFFDLRSATQGVAVFGGIGSGKTSGSGKALASAYLRAGFGALILTAKPDEVERWLRYAEENGRSNSVILFGDRGGGFNFLTYELARHGHDGIGSVIECLMRVLEAARLAKGGRPSEDFWEDTSRQLLRNTIPAIYSATGTVEVADLIRFISTAPKSVHELEAADWQNSSYMFQVLVAAHSRPVVPMPRDEFEKLAAYWRYEFASLDERTRSNIVLSLSTVLDRFTRGRLHRAFCTGTSLVPEMTFHGAIIIMDMPALTWNEDGIIGQQLFKYVWQRAVLSRNGLEPRHRERPLTLWADEAHLFANSADNDFQSTCRSSLACTVYLSQSLPTYYSKMGGADAKHKADMLLGNFAHKVFHANADPETNRWAADTIGRSLQWRGNYSQGESSGRSLGTSEGEGRNWGSNSGMSWSGVGSGQSSVSFNAGSSSGRSTSSGSNLGRNVGQSYSDGASATMDYEIEPGDFARHLRTGGPANSNQVTGVWFSAGQTFRDSGRNYLHVTFAQ